MTLKEIAARAGVSVATVSYVINGSASISMETREKVEKIIKETGYRSNMIAKSLRKNTSNLIGIIVEDITVFHTPYLIDGINKIAEMNGYNTILSNLRLSTKIKSEFKNIAHFQKDIDRAMDVLLGMQVDGVIYVGMHDRKITNILKNSNKPIVYCYCYNESKGFSVRYDNEDTAYRLTRLLVEKGYTDIAVMNGLKSSEPAQLRYEGFCRAMKEANLILKEENIMWGDWSYKEGKGIAYRLLARKNPPQAIVAMNDEMAAGIYETARELRMRIPEDIAVTGFDNAESIWHLEPSLTTAERPLREMGYKAMEILLNNLTNRVEEETCEILPCRIITGKSVR